MDKRSDGRNHLSVVVIGHVDSGKSTTTGHLVALTGGVDKRVMDKLEEEAKKLGKDSFKFAYLLDKTLSERERGITINTTQIAINTPKTQLTVIDAPGHKDFIKNMITGTSVSDVAILVIPASEGEFETALGPNGSAREHATLANTMGVKTILVCINKMDTIPKDQRQRRYEEIKAEALSILKKIGFKPTNVAFVPISGYFGWNLVTPEATELGWYTGWEYDAQHPTDGVVKLKGKTVFDWCDSLIEPARPTDKPLRIVTDAAFKVSGVGSVITGRVETGILTTGDVVYCCPANITAEVKSIESHHEALKSASPGDSIGFNLKNVAAKDIRRGNVVGHVKNDPPRQCQKFVAQTLVLASTGSKDKGFRKGFCPVCDAHTAHFQVCVEAVQYKIDKRTGKKIVEADDSTQLCLKTGEVGFVEFVPKAMVCLEVFSQYAQLGRMACREGSKTIGVCVIKEITKLEIDTGKGGKGAAAAKAGGKGKK